MENIIEIQLMGVAKANDTKDSVEGRNAFYAVFFMPKTELADTPAETKPYRRGVFAYAMLLIAVEITGIIIIT